MAATPGSVAASMQQRSGVAAVVPPQRAAAPRQCRRCAAARAPQRGGAPGPVGGGLKPGAPASASKDNFVICEICDGYIRDLEQLRNHMQFIHKVKIHPKMIHNRPPLNCQKCQFRFFTDQVRHGGIYG